MPSRFGYSRWDGTQAGFELDADEVLADITDDVLYHGDLNAALRRLLQSGVGHDERERIAGLRELLEQLRQRRRQELERFELGSLFEDLAHEVQEIVDLEREAIDRLAEAARRSVDASGQAASEQLAAERRLALDLLPPDLPGRIGGLRQHEFTSPEAHQRFEDLVDRLRQDIVQTRFGQMTASMSGLGPERLQRTKDMLDALNRLLEMREDGIDTDLAFRDFIREYGDFFPGNPQSLDELLEHLARQMAAMQALLNSMTPEQRAELDRLAGELLEDIDLSWQLSRLTHNLRNAFPEAGWDRRHELRGQESLGLGQAGDLMSRLGEIDHLEELLRSATQPGALAEVDLEEVRRLVGDDAARSLDRLAQLSKLLADAGYVEHREGRLELTPKGLRRIGRNALSDLFTKLARDRLGRHPANATGGGQERSYETKAYEFGDPFNLDIERTVRNAVTSNGRGTPVRLSAQDFEVDRTESLTRTATVLLLDLSLSMPIRDNFLAAKKVAMALHSLITTQFPRDFLGIVGFSELARELEPQDLPEVSWDFVYGTNMQHALLLSRRLLARQTGTRQIVMITDGEPTAHVRGDGEVFFHYPPVRETVQATLGEVARCTREEITINTFMLEASAHLKSFVERLTELNRGRAFFTTPETLGDYVLVDYIEQKRAQRLGRRGA